LIDAKQTEFELVTSDFIIAGNKSTNKHSAAESDFQEPAFSKHLESLNDETQQTIVLQ
jgi:hypothetical protein